MIYMEIVYNFMFVCTRESIRWKVDHGGQIIFWYWQHATNLAKATVFVICMSSAKVLVWVRGRVEQKHSLTFCVFGQIRRKCSSSSKKQRKLETKKDQKMKQQKPKNKI